MFRKNNKTNESILDNKRFRPEIEEEIEEGEKKINYLQVPLAKNSKMSFFLSMLAFIISYIAVNFIIILKGNSKLYISSLVFSSIIFSLYSLRYVYKAFKEKKVRQVLTYISLFISGIQLVLWLSVVIVGVKQ